MAARLCWGRATGVARAQRLSRLFTVTAARYFGNWCATNEAAPYANRPRLPSKNKESIHEWFHERTESAALGRSSLLPSQQGQPVASLRQRDELPLRLCGGVLRSRDGRADRLACRHDDPPGGPSHLRAAGLRP